MTIINNEEITKETMALHDYFAKTDLTELEAMVVMDSYKQSILAKAVLSRMKKWKDK